MTRPGLLIFLFALLVHYACAQSEECVAALPNCMSVEDMTEMGSVQTDEEILALFCEIIDGNVDCFAGLSDECDDATSELFINMLIYVYPVQCAVSFAELEEFHDCADNHTEIAECDENGIVPSGPEETANTATCEEYTQVLECVDTETTAACGADAAAFVTAEYAAFITATGTDVSCTALEDLTSSFSGVSVGGTAVSMKPLTAVMLFILTGLVGVVFC